MGQESQKSQQQKDRVERQKMVCPSMKEEQRQADSTNAVGRAARRRARLTSEEVEQKEEKDKAYSRSYRAAMVVKNPPEDHGQAVKTGAVEADVIEPAHVENEEIS